MAESNVETFERFGINRIYETSQAVANKLRRMADDIENEIGRAKDNEEHANLTRATSYLGLPAQVVAIVASGVANAQIDNPARQLRELLLAREAQRVIDARTAEATVTGKCPECFGEGGKHKMDCSIGRTAVAARFAAIRNQDRSKYPDEIFEMPKEGNQ